MAEKPDKPSKPRVHVVAPKWMNELLADLPDDEPDAPPSGSGTPTPNSTDDPSPPTPSGSDSLPPKST